MYSKQAKLCNQISPSERQQSSATPSDDFQCSVPLPYYVPSFAHTAHLCLIKDCLFRSYHSIVCNTKPSCLIYTFIILIFCLHICLCLWIPYIALFADFITVSGTHLCFSNCLTLVNRDALIPLFRLNTSMFLVLANTDTDTKISILLNISQSEMSVNILCVCS